MKSPPRAHLRNSLRAGSRLARRARSEVKDRLSRRADDASAENAPDADLGAVSTDTDSPVAAPPPSPRQQLEEAQRSHHDAVAELEALSAERDQLRADRRAVQQELGAQHGKRVMPRLKVEKTNGTPSFVVGARMMQRVYRRALDPYAGLDGVGAVFAEANPQGSATFAASHGVPVRPPGDRSPATEETVVVHAFKGEVGLVEAHGVDGVRHFDSSGEDPGDIRPALTYDPSIEVPGAFNDICSWADVLSAHIPRPYVQLLFASDDRGAFLHRIEVDPDRIPVLTPSWDERLGAAFDNAYSRFLLQPYHAGGLANRVPGGTFEYEEIR